MFIRLPTNVSKSIICTIFLTTVFGYVVLYRQELWDIWNEFPTPKMVDNLERGCNCSNSQQRDLVPNIVHYIWFSNKDTIFPFHHMLSVMSAHKILKPDVILFHTNRPPTGSYWAIITALSSVKVIHRVPPRTLFGEQTKTPAFPTSHSNIARVDILLQHGGIYLDLDVIALKPFDVFRHYPCTVGMETDDGKVCGGLIIATNTSSFMYIWANAYLEDYRVSRYAYNSGEVPAKLVRRYPSLVHVVHTAFHRPNWTPREVKMIWGPLGFDWSDKFAIHLWYQVYRKLGGKEPSLENIVDWPGAFGEIARFILHH